MEKGSFQKTQLGNNPEVDSLVKKIPLPNRVPKPRQPFPEDVVRSSTIDALIQQNEDLMARLSVTLRKNSQMEQALHRAKKRFENLQVEKESLNDQVLIYQSKENKIGEIRKTYEDEIFRLHKENRLLETRFAELYAAAQDNRALLNEKMEILTRHNSRLRNYRKRAYQVGKSYIEHSAENARHAIEYQEKYQGVKIRFQQTIERLQEIEKNHRAEILTLTQSAESKEFESQKMIRNLEIEVASLKDENTKIQDLYEKKVQLENEKILAERKLKEAKEQAGLELSSLQDELMKLRRDETQRILEIESTRSENDEFRSEVYELKQNISAQAEQVESLQALWRDCFREVEQLREKNESLQKLNQQISAELNKARRKLSQTNANQDDIRIKSRERIHELEQRIHLLTKEVDSKSSEEKEYYRIEPQLMGKLKTLLAEAQSGIDAKESQYSDEAEL